MIIYYIYYIIYKGNTDKQSAKRSQNKENTNNYIISKNLRNKEGKSRPKDLENSYNQMILKEKSYDTKIHSDTSIKCDNCDFITTSRKGLKIRNSRVNSMLNLETFPAACDICEKF